MLPLVESVLMAQLISANPERRFIIESQQVRPLPGQLDQIPMFNSNSPEVINNEGILLSIFPQQGKTAPTAHLNKPLRGRFDFFSHHISRPVGERRTLYQATLAYNPTARPVTVKILQGASYLTTPDAPFIDLPAKLPDPTGKVFSGPGSRLVNSILRGVNHPYFPQEVVIPPYGYQVLFSLPIPVSNARSTFVRFYSDGDLYLANLAKYQVREVLPIDDEFMAQTKESEQQKPQPQVIVREPNLEEWRNLLSRGNLVTPRDVAPSYNSSVYGRVAGVSQGSAWVATVTDKPEGDTLAVPKKGEIFSYPISTTDTGTYATQQIQSAPMLVRYPDTAVRSHGNYGVSYNLTFPLVNPSPETKTVTISLETPFKQNRYSDRLFFVEPPEGQIFFRGTVRVSYQDDRGRPQTNYFHLVQRQGQQSDPLVTLTMPSGDRREVKIDLIYPPDATPPQVLTFRSR
jgi:hypothetical protein